MSTRRDIGHDECNPVVVLHPAQTQLHMDKLIYDRAIEAAFRITMSPHEWEWSPVEQCAMAAFVLYSHQRLGGIEQLARELELRHQ